MHLGESLEYYTVTSHGVEYARQGKHSAQETGAEREYRAHVDDPFDDGPADLVEYVRKGRVRALRTNSLIRNPVPPEPFDLSPRFNERLERLVFLAYD